MSIDVVQAVREGKSKFEWKEILREHKGHKLWVPVMRDAMKFDGVPATTWDWKPTTRWDAEAKKMVPDDRVMDGVRPPAKPRELQDIADLIGAMLMTPLVIEEIWLQADIKFPAVVNTANPVPGGKRVIVANSDILRVHEEIEEALKKAGGDDGEGLISCVGKYWCLTELLWGRKAPATKLDAGCNFGWMYAGTGRGVTGRVNCYQNQGFHHDYNHWDPSQTIRLMHQFGRLLRAGSDTVEDVWLPDICADKDLCGLLNYTGKPLTYLRQVHPGPQLEQLGTITLPEVTIYGSTDNA